MDDERRAREAVQIGGTCNVRRADVSKHPIPLSPMPTLTNVPHRVVRRVHCLWRDLESEEAAVRALAPLQLGVGREQGGRLDVRGRGRDVGPEGRRRRYGRPCELDAERAGAGGGVVR